MPNQRRNRRRKYDCRKILSIITKSYEILFHILHYTLALLVDILALALLWTASLTACSMIDVGRWACAVFFGVLGYSCGPLGHPVWSPGSLEENERIAVVVQLERFGEGMCWMVLVPTRLWMSTVVSARDVIRNNDQSFPDMM